MGINNMAEIEAIAQTMGLTNNNKSVKYVKADKGLIERVESSKIVLTEDNKQLLND